MKAGISIAIVYTDEHLMQLSIVASNGVFAGKSEVYGNHDVLDVGASRLRGFPISQSDQRNFEMGTFDPAFAGGGARIRLYCSDPVGHLVAEVSLRSDLKIGGSVSDAVTLYLRIEAASVDSFVAQLEQMQPVVGQAATLDASA